MRKEKVVAQLLFIETFGMGIVSIIIGILVGMLLASVAGNFLMNGMEISAKGSYASVHTSNFSHSYFLLNTIFHYWLNEQCPIVT